MVLSRNDAGRHRAGGPKTEAFEQLGLWARICAWAAFAFMLLAWFTPWASEEVALDEGAVVRAYWAWGVAESPVDDSSLAAWQVWFDPALRSEAGFILIQIGMVLFGLATLVLFAFLVEELRGRRKRARFMGPTAAIIAVLGASCILATLALTSGGEGFGLMVGAFVAAAAVILATVSGAASQALHGMEQEMEAAADPAVEEWLFAQETLMARPPPVRARQRPAAEAGAMKTPRRRFVPHRGPAGARGMTTIQWGARPGMRLYLALAALLVAALMPWASALANAELDNGEHAFSVAYDVYIWGLRISIVDIAPDVTVDRDQQTLSWFSHGEPAWQLQAVRLGFVLIAAAVATGLVVLGQSLWGDAVAARRAALVSGLVLGTGTAMLMVALTSDLNEIDRFVLGAGPFLALLAAILLVSPSQGLSEESRQPETPTIPTATP